MIKDEIFKILVELSNCREHITEAKFLKKC